MDYEIKIKELTERIEVLERAENKRVIKRKVKIYSKIGIALIVAIILISSYIYVNQKYIKPYKEKIDYINEKIEIIEDYTNNKFEDFKDLFKKKD